MLDTNELSLDDDTFAWSAHAVSRRHVADRFATIAWFRALAADAGAASVVDVARFYNSGAPESEARRKTQLRQWSQRSNGRRTPSAQVVAASDALCPGSAELIDHPLWAALRTDWFVDTHFSEVCRRLPHEQRNALKRIYLDRHIHLMGERTRSMKRGGTLNDLACLLVLLRRANDAAAQQAGYLLARHVHHVLLVQAGWLCEHGLLRPLVEYVDQQFFGHVPIPFDGVVSAGSYFQMLGCLAKAVAIHCPAVTEDLDAATWHRVASSTLLLAAEL